MAETTKHRGKKARSEPINLDDWGNAGALDGLLSFLNITPEQAPVNQGPVKVLDLLEQRQQPPKQASSITGTVSITDREADIHNATTNLQDTELKGTLPVIQDVQVLEASAGKLQVELPAAPTPTHPKQATGFGNKRLHRCLLAQDGHSHTEEVLYQILWKAGRQETDDTRLTIMGLGEMAKRTRLSFNNTKNACRRLMGKLAVEEAAREVSDVRQGKTYRIFSYRAILERRKAVGMEWVIRNKGVEFVMPVASDQGITGTLPDINIKGTLPDIPITDPVPDTPITGTLHPPLYRVGGPGSISGRGTLPDIGGSSLLGFNLGISFREGEPSSSVEAISLLQVLADFGQPDDDVVQTLLARCREVAPDCSVAEIIHFVHQKGALIRQDHRRRITSPMGFLLTAVPKCFVGETLAQYRQQEYKHQEEERAMRQRQEIEIEQWRREQESILKDPNASEEDKRFARRILGI